MKGRTFLVVIGVIFLSVCCTQKSSSIPIAPTSNTNWENLYNKASGNVFDVGISVTDTQYGELLVEVGTAFRVQGGKYFTNGHIALALQKFASAFIPYWINNGFTASFVLVPSGGKISNALDLQSFTLHPAYDTTLECPDMAQLYTLQSPSSSGLTIASSTEIEALVTGLPIATIGFPSETEYFNYQYPVATLKSGSVSALRPLKYPFISDSTDYLIQYDFDLTGGTSGSPVFNEAGNVIAVNYSGYEQGSIDFGIRSDLLNGFSSNLPRTNFNSSDIRYDKFLLEPGLRVGDIKLGTTPDVRRPEYSRTNGNVSFYTDSLSYMLQVAAQNNVIVAMRLYNYDKDLFDPPFFTQSNLYIGANISRIPAVFTPSDINVVEQVLGSDTVSISEVRHEGIAFVQKPNEPFIRDIFVFPADSIPHYEYFSYDKPFLAKRSNQVTGDGLIIIHIPTCYIK
jgi:hypothetical protein